MRTPWNLVVVVVTQLCDMLRSYTAIHFHEVGVYSMKVTINESQNCV